MSKTLNILTKLSFVLLVVTFILSIFNIGPTTKPIYFYTSDIDFINAIAIGSIVIVLILLTRLIMMLLNKVNASIFNMIIHITLINLMIDIVFGGNIIYFIAYTITFILVVTNSWVTKKANN